MNASLVPWTGFRVLTTDPCVFGASVLLREGLIREIAERSGNSLCLVPLSTEEVELLPTAKNDRMREMSPKLRDLNRMSDLDHETALCDHVSFYDRETDRYIC